MEFNIIYNHKYSEPALNKRLGIFKFIFLLTKALTTEFLFKPLPITPPNLDFSRRLGYLMSSINHVPILIHRDINGIPLPLVRYLLSYLFNLG